MENVSDNTAKELEQISKNRQKYVVTSDAIKRDLDITALGTPPVYGSCYGMEIGWTQASAVQNTWYDISDADMVDGILGGVVHDGSGQLKASKSGKYAADWAGAFEADAANVHIVITFSINGTEVNQGMNHYHTAGANREAPVSGNAILNLSVDDTVNISIRTTDAGTPDLLVDHLMIRLVKIDNNLQNLATVVATLINDLKKQKILE